MDFEGEDDLSFPSADGSQSFYIDSQSIDLSIPSPRSARPGKVVDLTLGADESDDESDDDDLQVLAVVPPVKRQLPFENEELKRPRVDNPPLVTYK
jgi:hypothetical protein